ncbi:MAG: ThuA domain-containing protein, partial [Planctomycetes bacterium]|nr:ThuA domain-containing protein [Planctomycetota bacterium]
MLRRQIAAVVLILIFAAIPALAGSSSAKTLKALIVDGQNNHNWQETTPVLKKLLEQTGLYTVDVATSPAKKEPMDDFKP